jgi:SPP1 family predicted phage head-tail adaptor
VTDPIGALRARIKLQRPVRTADELGGATLSWADAGDVWAAIIAAPGAEAFAADALAATAPLRIIMRRVDGVRAGWRILWRARRFRIAAVADDGGPRLALSCEEDGR